MPSSLPGSVPRRLAAIIGSGVLLGSTLLVVAPTAGLVLAGTKGDAVGPVEVSGAVYSDVSGPVRDLTGVAPTPSSDNGKKDKPLRPLPNMGTALKQADGALQTSQGSLVGTTAGIGFDGVGACAPPGSAYCYAPPDTNGAVGATQYVQWVNTAFAVFDKSTGALASGFPKAGNSIWAGFGGGCQTNNDGDPIVQYDKLANRWVLTQFSVSTTPYLQCVAVSTTSDATGSYYRYAFSYGTTQFNDYPKLGVWPDGYYMSYNIFNNGKTFAGSKVCALDRTKMLVGDASATQQCFQLSTSYGGLLPSDLDGTTPPPTGSPDFFLNYGLNSLRLWKFHVDFATPANTAFTGPTPVANVAAFSAACSGGGTCIPQRGTTQLLDSLADRLMYRLAYRNLGDHESLVVNQSVTAGSSVGVRWYEIRSPNATPSVYQQGTYAPDSTYRWMGSIAMDHVGDIAVGYSGSSSSSYPYVAYASRTTGDALGTLSAETVVKSGGGSQSGSNLSRWGDYSAMSVDPVDDCTFWYTNEYLKTTGAFNWSTWIASFSFPGCTNAAKQNQTISFTSTAPNGAFVGGPTYTVTASATSGLPVSLTIDASATSVCSISGSTVSFVGAGTCVVDANQAGNANYTAASQVQQSFAVAASAPPDFSLSASPSSQSVRRGNTATYTVTITALNGFNGAVTLSITGQPSGSTVTFTPNPAATSSTLTVATLPGTTRRTYTLTITGVSGSLSHSINTSRTVTK